MNTVKLITTAAIMLLVLTSPCRGAEIISRFAVLEYSQREQVRRFNQMIDLGNLKYRLKDRRAVTVSDDIGNKVDIIVQKVQEILEMFPEPLHFRIVLLDSKSQVREVYRKKFSDDAEYIAFYSPRDKTIFTSVEDINLAVLTHEVAHVILAHYFLVAPSEKIHEVLAQYVERNIAR
ncbi:hypothetical protein ACFL6N_01510 [Thermodesulfobacteriota bacterium]